MHADAGIDHASFSTEDFPMNEQPIPAPSREKIDGLKIDTPDATELQRELEYHKMLHRSLFDDAPVPMMLEDWSGIKAMVRELRAAGVEDWEAYFAAHPDFFARAQKHLVYLDANKATIALFGAESKEKFFYAVRELLPKDPGTDSEIVRAMTRGDRIARGERHIRTLDGRKLAIIWQVDVSLESSDPMLFIAIDITERMNTEEALSKAQAELTHAARAAVLGEMAASIAHEVNQPLAAIAINADSALRWLDGDVPDVDRARASLQKIARNARHAGDVVRKIKGFVRKEEPAFGALSVADVLTDTELIVQREARNNHVILRFHVDSDVPFVRGVKVQVQQVLVNLIVNAIHALAEHQGSERLVGVFAKAVAPDRVHVEVRDTGPGIPLMDLDRIFEPFFSTRSEGLGLGLSICRSIVESHGGRIRASNHGSGAAFSFELMGLSQPL
jgi:signal transduction histidine kinase